MARLSVGFFPPVMRSLQQGIDHGYQWRAQDQCETRTVRLVVDELDGERDCRDDRGKRDTPERGIGRRLWVRNHEEREDEQGAVLQLVHRDRQRITQPQGPPEQQRAVKYQEGNRRFCTLRAGQHLEAEAREAECTYRSAAPLARRYPGVFADQLERDLGHIGRVENMLAFVPDNKLACYFYRGCRHGDSNELGA
mgnify:CR=1 FL=1